MKHNKAISNLWQQPISGDEPIKLTNFENNIIWNFTYTQNGKNLLISRGTTIIDVVMIENF